MAKSKNAADVALSVEWFGGIYSTLPALHIGSPEDLEADDFTAPPAASGAAEVLVWMTAEGTVLGKQTYAADQAALHAVTSFLQTAEAPIAGVAHQPNRLVIGDSALAAILRKGLPANIKIAIEDTMELDDLMLEEFELYPVDVNASAPGIAALLR